ncbi:MAG: hypothetical protein AVDCRST_MAG55-1686, partial [uncultured Rubrobacteraceae bacterium]
WLTSTRSQRVTFSGFCTPYRRSWVSYTTSSART